MIIPGTRGLTVDSDVQSPKFHTTYFVRHFQLFLLLIPYDSHSGVRIDIILIDIFLIYPETVTNNKICFHYSFVRYVLKFSSYGQIMFLFDKDLNKLI